MKTRIISAIILLAILVPIIICGGLIFDITLYLVSLLGLKEFLDIKEEKKQIPNFIKIVCYVVFTLFLFGTIILSNNFSIDMRIIYGLFLIFLIPSILYQDKNLYSINDAFYLIGGVLFLSISFSSIMILRKMDLNIFIYLVLITVLTDTYAYLAGFYIGKHKMIKNISPNKTWEGAIIGTAFSVFAATIFYHNVIDPNLSIGIIVLLTLFLSILGQFGDLIFSAIKRYFGKKDFSNLIPGHGGILDRLDSIVFVSLGFMFVISML